MFFIYIVMWFYLGAVPVILCATVYVCCAKFLRVPCLRIQRGCKCEKVSWDTVGSRTSRESRFSETLIVWRNTSVTFARDHVIRHSRERIKRVLDSVYDAWLQCSRPSRQPACILPCAHLVIRYLYLQVSAQRFEPGGFVEPRRFRIIFP